MWFLFNITSSKKFFQLTGLLVCDLMNQYKDVTGTGVKLLEYITFLIKFDVGTVMYNGTVRYHNSTINHYYYSHY